ncbi:MAG: efflux RND transporter periplasmic adaptor subunit [Opitutae bacterium]|nr:efflux RND transporter periplasmic adaptor subunit [Opitutae bacterium]
MKSASLRAAALLGAGLGLLFSGCQKTETAPETVRRRVTVAPVAYTRDLPPIEASGLLTRKLEATLSFKVGGVVAEVLVRAGETVKQGQPLARLQFAEIDALVAQARSAVEKAKRDAERVRRLHAERVATLEQEQDSRTAVEVAEANLRIAEFNRRHSDIVAPADGRILRRFVEPNELVAPGQPVLGFGADGAGWIFRAGVPEREIRRVAVGDAATLQFRGPPDVTLPATVTQVAEAADPATRTFEVELALPAAPEGLRSGAVGSFRLAKPAAEARARVPLSALLEGHERHAVLFALEPDGKTVRRHPVEIETLFGDTALLATAIPATWRIVTAGADYVRDGETVEVAPAP